MKKGDLFSNNSFKRFKSSDEFSGFIKQLQKRGIEKMLEENPMSIWAMTKT